MTSQFSSIQSNKNYAPVYGNTAKTLATQNKSLSKANEAQGGASVVAWVENANNRSIYDSIMAGTSDLSQGDQQTFMQWWSWAMGQIQAASSGFDPLAGSDFGGQFGGDPMAGDGLPEGAQPGPNGNAVFRTGTATTTYSPTSMPIDVLSDEFTLNVDVKVQDVTVEKTMDTRLSPAEEVIKIIVKDPYSQPSETVYFVHEMDAKVKINTVGGDGVHVNGDIPNVTTGTYSEVSQSDSTQSSIPGEPVKDAEGKAVDQSYYYEAQVGPDGIAAVNFSAQAGENETHYVVGAGNISIPLSSSANVEQGSFASPDGFTNFDFKVTVTHKDGSTDTFYLQDKKDFAHNINGLSENVKWNGQVLEKVPTEFAKSFSLNGGTSAGSGINPEHADDTPPAEGKESQYWPKDWKSVVYDSPTVNIHPKQDPVPDQFQVEVHAGELNITLDSMMDEVTQVAKLSDYYQIIIKFADGTTQMIRVDKDAIQKISINGGKISPDVVPNIQSDPVFSIPGMDESNANAKVDPMISDLAREVGKSVETVLEEIYDHFEYIASEYDADEDGALSAAEINQAIKDGAFPPEKPNQAMLEFIKDIDDDFSRHLNRANEYNGDIISDALADASQRLVDIFEELYPDMAGQISFKRASGDGWKAASDFQFGDMKFEYTNQTEGQTGQLNFSEL